MKYFLCTLLICCTAFIASAQHTVILKTGEKLHGELQSIQNNTVAFFYKGTHLTFQVGEISSIIFDGEVKAPVASTPPGPGGVNYVMPGRKLVKKPKVDNLTMEKGIVVIAITINKYGNVIKADPGAEGTTTTSEYLLTKAKQAAESVMFDGGGTFPLEQKGSITVVF